MTAGHTITLIAVLLTEAVPCAAQVRKASGVPVGDRIVVQLYAIVADSEAYSPVARRQLEVRGAGDSLSFMTNDAGGGTVLLSRGLHHAVVREPVSWRGRALFWDVPFDVHPGMGDVLLTLRNATRGALTTKAATTTTVSTGALATTGPVATPSATAVRVARPDRVFVAIDGSTWEVFQEKLGGPPPSPGGRPADSLYALVFTNDQSTRQLNSFPRDWRRLPDSALVGLFKQARVVVP